MADRNYSNSYRQSWALVIGIDTYQDSRLAPLQTAARGARAVARLLEEELEFPKENIILLENKDATQRAIRRAFTDPLGDKEKVSNDDRVLIYFGGHGLTFDTAEGEIGAIAPYDAEMAYVDTVIPMDELTRLANRSHAKHVLFLLDACFSGYATVRDASAGIKRQINDYLSRMVRQVITAGSREQAVSDVWGPDQHSLFTGFLLDGLRGAAPAPGGVLRAFHLAGYLQDQVAQHSRSHQTPQYAALMGSQGGDFIFKVREVADLPSWLMAAMNDDDPSQRLAAVGQLRTVADSDESDKAEHALALLEKLTQDPDSMVRASARGALRELLPSTSVAPIERVDLLSTGAAPLSIPEKDPVEHRAVLEFQSGPFKGGRFPIDEKVITIGRTSENNLVLWEENVSREHARIEWRDTGLWIEDMGSTNGTFVNNIRLETTHRMREEETYQIGRSIFTVEFLKAEQADGKADGAPKEESDATQMLRTVDLPKNGNVAVITIDNAKKLGPALRIEPEAGPIHDVAFSPDGQQVAAATDDNQVLIWQIDTGALLQTLKGHSKPVLALAWAPGGKQIATASEDHSVGLWNPATGVREGLLTGHTLAVGSLAYAPNGKMLATGGRDYRVFVWDTVLGSQKYVLAGHTGWVSSVVWTGDGRQIVSGSGDRTIRVWDVEESKMSREWRAHEATVDAIALSPDDNQLASVGGTTIIWSFASGKKRSAFDAEDASHVSWSPDGVWLATPTFSKIHLWEVRRGERTVTLQGHTNEVRRVVWSNDGRRLASASSDGTIIIWQTT